MTAAAILDAVADQTGITVDDILSRRRTAQTVYARQLAYLLIRNELDWSYRQIGELFHRGQATVFRQFRTIRHEAQIDIPTYEDVVLIRRRLHTDELLPA